MSTARPAQRTLEAIRGLGCRVGMVERFIPAGPGRPFGNRSDLFGIIDIIAITPGGILGIQACGTDWAPHIAKIEENEEVLSEWLAAGARFQLWGWRKVKLKRGGKAVRWRPRIQEFTRDPFLDEVFWDEKEEHDDPRRAL